MRKFLIGLAIYAAGLYWIGTFVLPANAQAGHWVFCSGHTKRYPYNHIAHSPKKCSAPGLWIVVPW